VATAQEDLTVITGGPPRWASALHVPAVAPVATKLPGPADSKKLACRSGMSPARCGRQRCAGCAWRAICANDPVYARRSKWCWAPRSIPEGASPATAITRLQALAHC